MVIMVAKMAILKILNILNCKQLQCYCTLQRMMKTNAMPIYSNRFAR